MCNSGGWQGGQDQAVQERAPRGTPGPLAALPPQGCGQGDQGHIAAVTACNISVWTWSGNWRSHAGTNVSGMKFFTQQKVPRQEAVPGGVVGPGGAGMRGSPACLVTLLALSCWRMDVLSPSAGELSG